MTDVTPVLSSALKKHDVSLTDAWRNVANKDEFLKEAYRIEAHVSSLHRYLLSIRQAYLSTAAPRKRISSRRSSDHDGEEAQHLTNTQRDEIDHETKTVLRELHAAIQNLSEAEQIRQRTESTVAKRHHQSGLGALGRWAAGGGAATAAKSPEEELEGARMETVRVHREAVIWLLQRKLEDAGDIQRTMMETRIMREVEKSKSALYKSQAPQRPAESPAATGSLGTRGTPGLSASGVAQLDEAEKSRIESQLSPEQLQLFAEENQSMLKYYEDTLDQVRVAEKSLVEISELQTTLANNLAVQSAHIDQLVADSSFTTENVGGGNKQLKRAAERRSTAKLVFYGSCAFSAFLIVYDLII